MNEITLAEKVQGLGLEPEQSKPLLDNFGYYFVQAHKLVTQAGGIKVTDESQVAEMKQAKELKKQLKDLRVAADKTRAALKEGYLRGGNAVQSIYNDIEKIVKPVEIELEQKEKFAEVMEAKRKAEKYVERREKLRPYVSDTSFYSIQDMSDEGFEILLTDAKHNFDIKQAEAAKIEADRIEASKKQNVYTERILKLLPYSRFLNPNDLTLETTDDVFNAMLEEGENGLKEYESQQATIKAENERLRKEATEKERLAAIERKAQQDKLAATEKLLRDQKQAQLDKERKDQEAVAAQKRADEEAQRKLLLAPDKEKLVMLAGDLSLFRLPVVQSREAGEIMTIVSRKISEVVLLLQEGARKL